MYANYVTALERNERKMAELKTDMAKEAARRDAEAAKRHADLTTAMERRDTKAAERENRLVFKMAAVVSLAVVILGFVMNFMIRAGGTDTVVYVTPPQQITTTAPQGLGS